MTPDSSHDRAPRFRFWLRRRALQAELNAAPWAYGAGFGLALWAITVLGRLTMWSVALLHGTFGAPSLHHAAWFLPELGQDACASLVIALIVGGLLRLSPRRSRLARWAVLALGYALLLAGSLIVIVSLPLYSSLQTTLQVTQLMLAGGVQDLAEDGLHAVSPVVFALAFALMLGACVSVPFIGAATLRRTRALQRPRRVAAAFVVAAVALATLTRVAPEDTASVMQTSAPFEFVASIARFYARQHPPPADMSKAPHFDQSLMFGKPPPLDPLEKLVNVSQLPLRRPNVVEVVLESATTLHTGLWNGRPEDTPRMAEMAQHGLVFDEYYSPSPVSMKSLFSMSCSSYPQTVPEAETYTNPSIDCLSLPELLKDRGYRNGLFHGGQFSYTRKDAFFRYRKYDVMRDASTLVNRRNYKKVPWGADDRAVIDDALQWIDSGNQNTPFFLHVIFLAPHEPYVVNDAPTPFGTKTDVDRYRNATLFIDSQVGRLWDALKQRGKLDDTLFVIVGDHGESFGEHRGDFMHGGRIYESSVHAPMMLVNPKLFTGQRTPRHGNHLDLVPTVLDVLGLPKPPRHQGASLLRGYKPHMLYFYANWHGHFLGLRDGQWKYIYNVDRERPELYDMNVDRAEQHNLAAGHLQQTDAYTKRLLQFEQFYDELIPNYEHYVNGKDACTGKAECPLDELKPVFQHGVMRKNKSGSGFPLQLAQKTYEHGIGVAPLSILRYNIRGDGFRRFLGGVGHHTQGGNANLSLKVSVEIYLDDRLIWSSGKLTADEPAKLFDLDVSDGAVLELIGYDVDAEDWRDYIDWVDVRLTR